MRLTDYPYDVVNVSCKKCDRRGRYKKQTLIERYGDDIAVPDLSSRLSADCPRTVNHQFGTDPCGIFYPDLLTRYHAELAKENEG